MNLIEETVCKSFIVKLWYNPIYSKYITKPTTVEPRQYFTHGRITNQQSKAVISLFLIYINISCKLKVNTEIIILLPSLKYYTYKTIKCINFNAVI